MLKFLKITCQEANEICNKAQYNEATLLEKLKLNLHIAVCKICALYTKQNRELTSMFKGKALDCKKESPCMSEMDKELLKQKMKELSS